MTYLPSSPEIGGPKLAAYVAADPRRRAVFDNIRSRLGPAGKVEALARYYIVRCEYRREVFREILLACRCRLPCWARRSHAAAEMNKVFVEEYREAYNAFRRESRGKVGGSADGR